MVRSRCPEMSNTVDTMSSCSGAFRITVDRSAGRPPVGLTASAVCLRSRARTCGLSSLSRPHALYAWQSSRLTTKQSEGADISTSRFSAIICQPEASLRYSPSCRANRLHPQAHTRRRTSDDSAVYDRLSAAAQQPAFDVVAGAVVAAQTTGAGAASQVEAEVDSSGMLRLYEVRNT
jgi:hypothetical protein